MSYLLFYLSIIFLLFLPGYFLLLAVFGRNGNLSAFEKFVIAPGLSLIILDFIAFALNFIKFPIAPQTILPALILFIVICYGIYKLKSKKSSTVVASDDTLFSFSKNQLVLILLLLFLTVFIKTVFLSGTIAPTATDMGHHMYWSKWLSVNEKLPTYEGLPDFIIGEHIIFGVTNQITGLDFTLSWPTIVLTMVNILSILAVFILALRIFKNQNIAILTLLFLGVLFAVASPEAKFVSGGVIGNLLGNYLLPLAFYFYIRAFRDWDKKFLSLAVFLTFGLLYTHHLTAFIFLFIMFLFIPIYLAVSYRDLEEIWKNAKKIILSPWVIGTFIFGLIFFFFVFTPTYVNPKAIDTAVGAPSKATRVGLTLDNISSTVGEARLALGFVGLILLALAFRRKSVGGVLLFSWAVMLFIMSIKPDLLFIDLPSARIGNYLSYPLAVLSALAVWELFQKIKQAIPKSLAIAFFFLLTSYFLSSGLLDSAQALKSGEQNMNNAAQTFLAANYLAVRTTNDDKILKDHNYLDADSWMKLSFMRGYLYPASRGFFKRYDDTTKPREQCTLIMISNPGGDEAKTCYSDTGTDFLVVNPAYDSGQFRKLNEFDQIFTSNDVAVFYKK